MDRRRRMPSYEEDMTPPRGMRNFRSNAVPTDEPMPPPRSFEEDMTPPRGMRNFRSNAVPSNEPIPGRASRMKEGGSISDSASSTSRSSRMQGNPSDEKGIIQDAKRQIESARGRIQGLARAAKEDGGEQKMKSGGAVKSSASSRGDGCATRGKTKGRMV